MSYPNTVVIMTMQGAGTPHAAPLQAANPGLDLRVHEGIAASGPEKLERWRNCDRNLREWWIANRETVASDAVLFMEWDVYCNVPLETIIPPLPAGVGMMGAAIAQAVRDGRTWPPFREIPRLSRRLQVHAIGIVPFAVLLLSRAALDALADPEWDAIYAADVFCELRTPTVVRAAGFRIAECKEWSEVTVTPRALPIGAVGMFHPIKNAP